MTTKLQAILFDKDGTLFDFQKSWGNWGGAVLQDLSGGDPDLLHRLADIIDYDLGNSRFLPTSIAIAGTGEEILQAMLPALPEADPAALLSGLEDRAVQAEMTPVLPLLPLLSELRGFGLKLGVATNAVEIEAQAHLEQAGILASFDKVLGCDSGFGAKPEPGMCSGFAQATGCDPAQVVMVGDSLHDLHAGRAAGMRTIGVLTGVASAHDLAPHADAILPDIGHLPAWLAPQMQG